MVTKAAPLPRTRRWTRAEYERLVELGLFAPGERLELIDGLLVVREPQGRRHAAGIRRVLAALHRALGDAWQIDSQLPIALDEASEPEPDVAVVPRDPGAYRDAHPSRPVQVVEIADTSYQIDREYKASLYARAGIPEYWLVDLAREAIEIHREPDASPAARFGWRYRTVNTLRPPGEHCAAGRSRARDLRRRPPALTAPRAGGTARAPVTVRVVWGPWPSTLTARVPSSSEPGTPTSSPP